MSATPFWEVDFDEVAPGSGEEEAATLLHKIDSAGGLFDFIQWGGPEAFEDEGLRFLAIDAAEAMKALDEGLTAWAAERGVSR